MAHPDWPIWVFVAVDNQGWILETDALYKIYLDYVIQPEQMDTLMANIRNGLRFTLHAEKAARFNWFEGQILIRLGNYIEDRDVRPSIPSVFPIGSGSGVILRP